MEGVVRVKKPTEPYWGRCASCEHKDLVDVGHLCTYCFALMDPTERSVHMGHIRWGNAGRPGDTDDPWG